MEDTQRSLMAVGVTAYGVGFGAFVYGVGGVCAAADGAGVVVAVSGRGVCCVDERVGGCVLCGATVGESVLDDMSAAVLASAKACYDEKH